jgi:hypothetical protein
MSDMKCPFCKKELKLIGEKSDSGYPIDEYVCGCPNCPETAFIFGNTVMWNKLRVLHEDLEEWRESCKVAEKELIRTREELYKANAELDYIKEQVEKSNAFIRARIKVAAEQIARGIIDQVEIIKSQKDVK